MRKIIIVTLLTFLIAAQWCSPANSSDDNLRLKGIAAYKAKNYKMAAKLLEEALEAGDGSADCYTYLAGAHYGSGNYEQAVRRYIDLKNAFKGLPAGIHAENILKRIDPKGHWAARVAKNQARKDSKLASEGKNIDKAEAKSKDPMKAKLEAKRAEVMREAAARCAKIRADAEKEIEHAKANSNQRYRYPDGSRGMDISEEHKAAIRSAAEDKCSRIMDTAERKARSYR